MAKERKIPLRKCVGCGEMKEKRELLRAVKTPQGEFLLDATGKQAGRGAYLCPCVECLTIARKARRLEKSFSCAIPAEVYDRLEEALKTYA